MARGALLALSRTVMITLSVSEPPRASVTLSMNVSAVVFATTGALNDAVAVPDPESVTLEIPPV